MVNCLELLREGFFWHESFLPTTILSDCNCRLPADVVDRARLFVPPGAESITDDYNRKRVKVYRTHRVRVAYSIGFNLQIGRGEKIGILGRNGAGNRPYPG